MDSSSTHNFLDMYKAKKLGCQIRKTCPLNVSVAGGSKLIRGYELVLGIKWLSTLGNIQWRNDIKDDTTWDMLSDIVKRFLEFVLDP
ncbi:hypothetical protein Tco_1053268 [Tanacetum coccineum]